MNQNTSPDKNKDTAKTIMSVLETINTVANLIIVIIQTFGQ